MITTQEVICKLRGTNGKNDKLAILKANAENKTLEAIMAAAYHPFIKYWVQSYDQDITGTATIDDSWEIISKLLRQLSSREVVGNAAKAMVTSVVSSLCSDAKEIVGNILEHNLRVGISPKVICEVWPGLIPIYEVASAVEATSERLKKIEKEFDGKTWLNSRKIDGLRLEAFVSTETVILRTKEGNEFKTLDKLKQPLLELIKHLDPNKKWVFSGEVCIIDEDGHENFRQILSEYNRDGHTVENPFYMVYDLLEEDEFFGKVISAPFGNRYSSLKQIEPFMDSKRITLVEQAPVKSLAEVEKSFAEAIELGWEGRVLRKNVPFRSGKSVDILKLKGRSDAEYVVEKIISGEGSYAIKGQGMVKKDAVLALVISHKGNPVKVGSGFTLEQAIFWKDNPSAIIGREVTVTYTGEINDKTGKASLRHPRLKCVYDKEGRKA
jgi:DNA ligase-1